MAWAAPILACIATMWCFSATAQPVVWRAATEYPATAMPGRGLTTFAALVAARSGGALNVVPRFDAPDGLKSAAIPAAVQAGRIEVGDAFAGALSGTDRLFALSSLPFLATDMERARRLAALARPDYERAFARLGQRLLYVTPWPASGLWSRAPIAGADDLKGLVVRTYDAVSTATLIAAGADARLMSFADAAPAIADGRVAAVLSSGDGGAGQKLWRYLPNFTVIGYAMPLSFTTVSETALAGLDPALREAVLAAATETEASQWTALAGREAANAAAMRENGVVIATASPEVAAVLARAGQLAVEEWAKTAGPEAQEILKKARGSAPIPSSMGPR